jgi:hypothetical protein
MYRLAEPELIEMAYAYEQGTMLRRPPSSAPAIFGDVIPEPSSLTIVTLSLIGSALLRPFRMLANRCGHERRRHFIKRDLALAVDYDPLG